MWISVWYDRVESGESLENLWSRVSIFFELCAFFLWPEGGGIFSYYNIVYYVST